MYSKLVIRATHAGLQTPAERRWRRRVNQATHSGMQGLRQEACAEESTAGEEGHLDVISGPTGFLEAWTQSKRRMIRLADRHLGQACETVRDLFVLRHDWMRWTPRKPQ